MSTMLIRRALFSFFALSLLGALWFVWGPMPQPDRPSPSHPILTAVSFTDLPGWGEDEVSKALDVFLAYCPLLTRRTSGAFASPDHWRTVCSDLKAHSGSARGFLERHFQAWSVSHDGDGLFTGYYEPDLRGSRSAHGPYQTPLYRKPLDLVEWELKHFAAEAGLDPNLPLRRLAGRVENGRLVPYSSRAEIVAGALDGQGLELLWVDDPVDAFFLQIQGSGRVTLDTGDIIRLGYDGQNGRPYHAIGRDLVAQNAIASENLSMQSIRQWLTAHPDQATDLMNQNPSFVFFREFPDMAANQGPLGAAGLPLNPERSLAVDPRYWPYGLPMWLDTTLPNPDGPPSPYQRLMIAGDTGGAIKGPVRGDIFFGAGETAAKLAGPMKQSGKLFILLPRDIKLDETLFQVSKR